MLATWNEADVVEANVANAFTQGCERVFLIDNDSDDDTVDLALSAGAELVERFSSSTYDERLRIRRMNLAVRAASHDSGHDQLWWLYLDADEFPTGWGGQTIRQQLEALHPRFRVLGARQYNHYPTEELANARGIHPIEFQPMCDRMYLPYCFLGHHKHPLVRFDRSDPQPQLLPANGFHSLANHRPRVAEPMQSIVVHHFPFRNEDATRARLQAVNQRCSPSEPSHERERFVDAVYDGDWAHVLLHRRRYGDYALTLTDWRDLGLGDDRSLQRWYADDDVETIRRAWSDDRAAC